MNIIPLRGCGLSKRKQYSSEFKREAVRLVTEGGLSIAQAARDLGLDDNMASRWKKEAEKMANGLFQVRATPKTKNSRGYDAKSKCSARSEKS
jgi:transposase